MIDRCLSELCPQGVKNVKKAGCLEGINTQGIRSNAAKSEFYLWKSQNAGELREIAAISSIKFHVNFFFSGVG